MLKVGVIGTGGIANSHISGYLAFQDECEIVAAVDVVPERARKLLDSHGLNTVAAYESVTEMLNAHDLDIVSITTPPATHKDLAVESLLAGVNVILEKPMAPSLEECDAILAAEQTSGKLLSVVAQNRFRDDLSLLKTTIDSGLIGPISHLEVNSSWWRGLPYYDLSWRGTWESEGGGCTLNHAIHHIDLLLWMMGTPESVTAVLTNAQHENSEVEDLSIAILKYERALAQITSSVVHHGEKAGIIVQGRNAMVAQPWQVEAELSQTNGFPVPAGNTELIAELNSLKNSQEALKHTDHAGQIEDFLKALQSGSRPMIDGVAGRQAVEIVTAIYKSGIEGTTVLLPITPDDPYYQNGTLSARAPRYYTKSGSFEELNGEISVGVKA